MMGSCFSDGMHLQGCSSPRKSGRKNQKKRHDFSSWMKTEMKRETSCSSFECEKASPARVCFHLESRPSCDERFRKVKNGLVNSALDSGHGQKVSSEYAGYERDKPESNLNPIHKFIE
ncbi:hypothetical protein CEXT_784561 [Caerostris extrusa]|uniref:Uncharacterized protein n=1 Tax=Caerostris extrusa TaxID=172846 RepID=A0AAV4R4F2_CAEEX|nr:hypothetical protein CEXT_784561 [Caerostris extrusa]